MSKKNPWLMDEPVEQASDTGLFFLQGALVVFLAVCAAMTQDTLIRVICIIGAALLGGLMALIRWLIRHYRVVMDEKGARMGSKHALEWTQVRTAVVIRRGDPRWPAYNSRRYDRHFILLSVEPPEKAIDKWTFRMEGAKPGRDLRIPYTYRRRQVVEHYLHMELPTFHL